MPKDDGKKAGRGRKVSKFVKLAGAAMLSAAICAGLNSCWVNTSGFIFDTASYDAKATTADIAVGNEVYEKKGAYYVYLPTYKTGKGPKLVYGIGAQDNRKERCDKNGHAYFRISTPYARYLTGQSDEPAEPEIYYDEDACRTGAKWKVVRTTNGKAECTFEDSCFGSSLLKLIGLVDFVAVDIPMSAACTSAMTAGTVVGGTYSVVKWATKKSSTAAGEAATTAGEASTAAGEAASAAGEAAASAAVPATTAGVTATTAGDAPAAATQTPSGQPPAQEAVNNGRSANDRTFRDPGMDVCWKCKGTGRVMERVPATSRSTSKVQYKICPSCKGKGVSVGVPTPL